MAYFVYIATFIYNSILKNNARQRYFFTCRHFFLFLPKGNCLGSVIQTESPIFLKP